MCTCMATQVPFASIFALYEQVAIRALEHVLARNARNVKNLLSAYYIIIFLAPTNTCQSELFLCGSYSVWKLYIQVPWIGKQVNDLFVHARFDI